jgi:hypothetical protein
VVLRFTWQARTTLLCGVITPLIAGLALSLWSFLPQLPHSVKLPTVVGALVTLFFIALPMGVFFGVIPGLIGGALYSAALTFVPFVRSQLLVRSIGAAALAGLVGGLWCQIVLGLPAIGYGVVSAISGFVFALRWPRLIEPAPSNNRWKGP